MRKTNIAIGEYYHVYSRGVDKRDIFLSNEDKERFTGLLYLCNGTKPIIFRLVQGPALYKTDTGEKLIAIGSYCLMNNHFHLLVKEIVPGGLAKFMLKLMTGYSMYFNKKYERTGALFSGRFKAQHVDNDEYLKYIFAYIHLNPLKTFNVELNKNNLSTQDEVKGLLQQFKYSSYLDFINAEQREFSQILNRSVFPEYFPTPSTFDSYIMEWIKYSDHSVQGPALY